MIPIWHGWWPVCVTLVDFGADFVWGLRPQPLL
jgi:hypothetical protein